jgi:hypothetical protein
MAQQDTKNQGQSTSSSSTQGGQGGSATKRSLSSPESTSDLSATSQGTSGYTNGRSDKNLIEQVKSTAADAYGTATSKATEKLEEQKSSFSSSLTSVAENIRKIGRNLGEEGPESGLTSSAATYTDTAADKIEQAARYFERHDVEAIYHDVEDLARQNPAIFIGGAFALGFLAARFLKSSNTRSLSGTRGGRRLTGETLTSRNLPGDRTSSPVY